MNKKTSISSFDDDDYLSKTLKESLAEVFTDESPEGSIIIINGPNLNFLGIREIEKYGSISYEELIKKVKRRTKGNVEFFQSNSEGEIVKLIQELVKIENDKPDIVIIGLVINPGGLTHTSVTLRDALSILFMPIVEVHITDITKRENYRKTNLISDLCVKSIIGKGIDGYIEGVDFLYEKN